MRSKATVISIGYFHISIMISISSSAFNNYVHVYLSVYLSYFSMTLAIDVL